MLFKTCLIDPPWLETGGGVKGGRRGADRHYPLMKTKDIAALPVADVCDPAGCHLYLWVTNNFLPDGLEVMKAWGFRYKTLLTGGKVNAKQEAQMGLGQYFRGASEQVLFGMSGQEAEEDLTAELQLTMDQLFVDETEHVLFGVKANVPYKVDAETGKRMQSTTLLLAPRGRHSEKPDEIYQRVERVSTGPYLEVFSRPRPAGIYHPAVGAQWTRIGNEETGNDVADDLRLLALK